MFVFMFLLFPEMFPEDVLTRKNNIEKNIRKQYNTETKHVFTDTFSGNREINKVLPLNNFFSFNSQ